MDDVNYLLLRRQMSQYSADHAAGPESRAAHLGLVALYTGKVDEVRDKNRLIARTTDRT